MVYSKKIAQYVTAFIKIIGKFVKKIYLTENCPKVQHSLLLLDFRVISWKLIINKMKKTEYILLNSFYFKKFLPKKHILKICHEKSEMNIN